MPVPSNTAESDNINAVEPVKKSPSKVHPLNDITEPEPVALLPITSSEAGNKK